jgi:hypothetical protein
LMRLSAAGALIIAFAMIAAAVGVIATHALTPALLRVADRPGGDEQAAMPPSADPPTRYRGPSLQARD